MWEITAEEINTVGIEIATIVSGILVLLVILYLKRKYPVHTQKGFIEFGLGIVVLISHFIFDLLDTIVVSDIIFESVFDILDAVFAFVGLFIIGYAFFKIAQYGLELWEGDK